MFHQQHRRNNTVLFCGLQSEISSATDFIADRDQNIAADITNEILQKYGFHAQVDHRSLKAQRQEALANGDTFFGNIT